MSRNKYPEQTIEKILEVFGHLFIENGYDSTSIDNIAKACGFTKGAIYHHFSSKEDLLIAMMESAEKQIDWFDEIKENEKLTGLEKLRNIFIHELSDIHKIRMDTIFRGTAKDPKILAKQLEVSVRIIAPMLEKILREGIEDGSLQTEYPKQVSEVLVILTNIWINPDVFGVSKNETITKIKFLNELLSKLGIFLFNDELMQMAENYLHVLEKESE